MTEVNLHTTITVNSVRQIFGPADAIDYRSHPGECKDADPLSIFKGMCEKELPPMTSSDTLKNTIYNFKNRRIITIWLRDVCACFHVKSTTLCLATQLTDAFIVGNLNKLPVNRCQLAAVTCFWIAAKFEEMDANLPSLRKVVDVCDCAYRASEILAMEESVMSFFRWKLPHVTVVSHVYLLIHVLNSDQLIKETTIVVDAAAETLPVYVLTLGEHYEHIWHPVHLPLTSILQDNLDLLCRTASLPVMPCIEIYQLYGTELILSRGLSLTTPIRSLTGDECGRVRMYLTTMTSQVNIVFAERDSRVILRSINVSLLNLCDVLVQEIVSHVEFMCYSLPSKAFGLIALALCLLKSSHLDECKEAVQHIYSTLSISASQSLAVAYLLNRIYTEGFASLTSLTSLPQPRDDIVPQLETCFKRRLARH